MNQGETLQILPANADAFIEAHKLQLSNEDVRAIFRRVCYQDGFEGRHSELTFRDMRLLKYFGHALEMAYYDQTNWAIMWAAALMLIARYRLTTENTEIKQPTKGTV